MRVVILHPYTEFEVRRPCHSETWRTTCVSINGPGDPDLFTLKLVYESHLRWANLPSKFGHARPLASRIIHYVCDERTDKSNAYWPLPCVGGIIMTDS